MDKVLYYDYAAFCLLTLILVSAIMKRMTRGKLNRQFLMVLITTMLAAVFDIGAIAYDNLRERHAFLQYTFHTGYLFFHVVSAVMYVIYVFNMVDAIHIFRGRVKSLVMALPCLICVGLLAVNIFYPTF